MDDIFLVQNILACIIHKVYSSKNTNLDLECENFKTIIVYELNCCILMQCEVRAYLLDDCKQSKDKIYFWNMECENTYAEWKTGQEREQYGNQHAGTMRSQMEWSRSNTVART